MTVATTPDPSPHTTAPPRRFARSGWGGGRPAQRDRLAGYVFLSPWLLGLIGITAIPTLYSLYVSFTDYDLLGGQSTWIGLANYRRMFSNDPHYWHSVTVTVTYALVAVPLKLAAALGVAMLLRRDRRGTGLSRALFYLPSLLGGSVGLAIVWQAMFSRSGAFNAMLDMFGVHGKPWVNDPDTALGTLVLLSVWQFGAPMVIFLAGLKQIPPTYYEAAAVDGAGRIRTFMNITWPMLSPVIFFNLVLEMIHGFQAFTPAFVVSNGLGGPADATLLYTLYIYQKGWGDYQMGYASSMAWVFLISTGLLTAVLFGTSRRWVHYTDGGQ